METIIEYHLFKLYDSSTYMMHDIVKDAKGEIICQESYKQRSGYAYYVPPSSPVNIFNSLLLGTQYTTVSSYHREFLNILQELLGSNPHTSDGKKGKETMGKSQFKSLSKSIRNGERPALVGQVLSQSQYLILSQYVDADYRDVLLSRVSK